MGMSKSDFLRPNDASYTKEKMIDRQNHQVERLLYQENLLDINWYTLTIAFTFQDGKLVVQEVLGKEYGGITQN